MVRRYAEVLIVLAVFTGCANLRVVEPQRIEIGWTYTVDPQIKWSRFYQDNLEVWTVDGLPLQAIYFIKGIEKDEPLVARVGRRDREKWPRFRPEMTPSEIMEFVVDSLVRLGYLQVQASNLKPGRFDQLEGFRFELAFLFRNGLQGQGLVAGAVIKERLYLIIYIGTQEYYYPKHVKDVEKIIQSIQLTGGLK